MTKHTPGPWKANEPWEEFGSTRFYISQQDDAPYTPNYSDVATLIAETCSGELVSIQAANARLIAAAPELLEALKDAVAALGGINSDNVPETCRAAISKAMP